MLLVALSVVVKVVAVCPACKAPFTYQLIVVFGHGFCPAGVMFAVQVTGKGAYPESVEDDGAAADGACNPPNTL